MESVGQDTAAAQHPEATETTASARVLRGRRRRTRDRGQPERPERTAARGRVHVTGTGRTVSREYTGYPRYWNYY